MILGRRIRNGDIFPFSFFRLVGFLSTYFGSLTYSLNSVDDAFLERAVSAIPKYSILLIEDIDCAFPSRENEEEEDASNLSMPAMVTTVMRRGIKMAPKSQITLSGLLNVLDGVGSEEGKIFFATVSYRFLTSSIPPFLMTFSRQTTSID